MLHLLHPCFSSSSCIEKKKRIFKGIFFSFFYVSMEEIIFLYRGKIGEKILSVRIWTKYFSL